MKAISRSWRMTRRAFTALSIAALAACAGLPPQTHPLFIARSDSLGAGIAAPRLTVEMNHLVLVLPASAAPGCLTGSYVRKGGSVAVELRQSGEPGGSCDGTRPVVTRIGPLSPGGYDVSVQLDGASLLRSERAVIP
jgi:hypothetical protein